MVLPPLLLRGDAEHSEAEVCTPAQRAHTPNPSQEGKPKPACPAGRQNTNP